ncbi:G-type lectin S-receptor-like serine/threonine-protein kinase CES101 isoform X1 [Vitis vinifera]|nr:G-type lectin S-receptor-like serine/threonine-protein kinase CES101 isoform X1 [Vitis vinifera]|eukprot:XP_019076788.1 PREDICTED: G-type lectin S-receptor-like serine/threonine-protein kinase CES101 isoform X1 [Vitis vinifera]
MLDGNGTLMIIHSGGDPIVLNSNQASGNSIATLLDSGNFVVSALNSDGSAKQTLWESFDDPTDTLLPGMKLGINLKTRQNWSLASWINEQVPDPGTFTLEWNDTQLVTKRREDIYWSSGILKDQSFEFFQTHHNIHFFISVCNDNETYFSYSVQDGAISKWVLNWRGGFFDTYGTLFVKEDMCDRYGKYPGCAVQEPPTCRTRDFQFMKQSVLNSGYPSLMNIDTSLGLSDCQAICRNNCSCTACNTVFTNGTGCQFWRDKLPLARVGDANQEELYVLSSSKDTGNHLQNISIICGVVGLVIILIFSCLPRNFRGYRVRREVQPRDVEVSGDITGDRELEKPEQIVPSDSEDIDSVKQFSLVSVMAATNNFSDENKLGKGGFGPVYKGILPGGQEIAVKRLSRDSTQGPEQFNNERLIAKQQHRNLVRLLGYCMEGEEKMLIYEFMPNRSLEDVLFAPAGRKMLDWNTWCKIIEGIAQGLDYLHRHSILNMVHRDLKASNILLDHDMNPKISDFGTARIFERNASEAHTRKLVGTFGYMPPEYVLGGAYSEKTDVYSFGVLLLEIVSGQRIIPPDSKGDNLSLIRNAWKLWGEGNSLKLVDPAVVGPHSTTQILKWIRVALLCIQKHEERPTMSEVCSMLNRTELPKPNPPAILRSDEPRSCSDMQV